ncbi:Uncharacterised protein [Yersinia aldovae]|uniref:Uncharacterized protein n=1 Tax=Yersinia aldovae TaxID=29483 RepID=A0A0T9T2E6_YERAL|nr:Uncharacterised protein [Yersinia aldovae]CNK55192.1 Uncharacterised protein [Yersinia aldovae]CNK57504.1 Uncharacterised protein [Yersinia aldovae]
MFRVYPSYFKLHVCWLRSLTRITYSSKLIGILSLAAFLQLELFWVYVKLLSPWFLSLPTGNANDFGYKS